MVLTCSCVVWESLESHSVQDSTTPKMAPDPCTLVCIPDLGLPMWPDFSAWHRRLVSPSKEGKLERNTWADMWGSRRLLWLGSPSCTGSTLFSRAAVSPARPWRILSLAMHTWQEVFTEGTLQAANHMAWDILTLNNQYTHIVQWYRATPTGTPFIVYCIAHKCTFSKFKGDSPIHIFFGCRKMFESTSGHFHINSIDQDWSIALGHGLHSGK